MERYIYVDCARTMVDKIRKEINGLVRFEVFPDADLIVFKIVFKEFEFNYALKDIQDLMYQEGFNDAVDVMLKKYRTAVLNAFFKTKEKKERDERKELGIESIYTI